METKTRFLTIISYFTTDIRQTRVYDNFEIVSTISVALVNKGGERLSN